MKNILNLSSAELAHLNYKVNYNLFNLSGLIHFQEETILSKLFLFPSEKGLL